MKKFSKKKLVVLIGLSFASHFAAAEPPAPPPVQTQEGPGAREGGRTFPAVPPAASTVPQAFDPLLMKPPYEPEITQIAGIPYGSFLLFPKILLTHTYDSNIYAERRNESSDWVTRLMPSLNAKSNWAQHALNLNIGTSIDSYRNNSSENVNDYWVGMNGRYDISDVTNVFGGVRHVRDHEDRSSADAVPGLEPTVYTTTEAHIGAASKFGPISVRAGATQAKYNFNTPTGAVSPYTNDDRDRTQDSVGARISYAASPVLEPFVQVATDVRHYDRTLDDNGYQRNSDGYRVGIGATYKPTPTLQGEVFVGHMQQDYDDNTRFADLSRPYFGANLKWKPATGTSISAFLDRALQETTLTGSSGYLDTSAGVSVERALGRDLLINAQVSHTQSEFQGINRTDNTTDASAGVQYYISPSVFVGADFRLTNRDSDMLNANYFRNQLMFSLGYTPGRTRPSASDAAGDSVAQGDPESTGLHGYLTPKLYLFDYTKGFGDNRVQFLERYNYQESTFGDNRRDGLIADLDLNVVYSDAKRDVLSIEHSGFGVNNQRTSLKANSDYVKFSASHSAFTSATGGIDFLYNPNAVVGGTDTNYAGAAGESKHVASFSFDSPETVYSVSRKNGGASILFKPAVFDGNGSVEVSYDGYTRNGNKMSNYVLPNAMLGGAAAEDNQWRGYSQPIDERNNRFAINLSLAPKDKFQLNYEFALDKFQSLASPTTFNTLSQLTGIGFGGPSNPHFTGTADPLMTLNFVADSTLVTNSLRFSTQFSDTAVVAAGLSSSRLKQDNFTDYQQAVGYTDGKIATDSAYLTGKLNISDAVGLEAFVRHFQRENNSSYPVAGFYEPISTSYADSRMVGPRINKVETTTYGLEAHLYPSFLGSSWTVGWTREDKDRDLTYGIVPSLTPEISLYRAHSSYDEAYLKVVARPAPGWTIRLTPSYRWSDETGLVTEPEEAVQLKALVSYAKPEWHEMLVSAFYNYTDKKNGLLTYSDYIIGTGFTSPETQKVEQTLQSAGLNLSLTPQEDVKVNLGYAWNQTDYAAYYFSTNRMRHHYPNPAYIGLNPNPAINLDFLLLDHPNYKVDTHTLSAGGEWQWNRYLLSGNYALSHSKGHNADGLAGQTLPSKDASVNSYLHSLTFGLEFALKENLSFRGTYTYDYYQDKVYQDLTGEMHTLMLGVSYRF